MSRKIHPAFVVAGAVFVVLLCAAAVRATPSILMVPLEREFGWSRALLSSAVSVNLVLYGLGRRVDQPVGKRLAYHRADGTGGRLFGSESLHAPRHQRVPK